MKLYPNPTRKGLEKLKDFSTRVIRQMVRNGLRRIHEVRNASGTMPTVDELENWIADHHPRTRRDFDIDKAQRMAYSAAVEALTIFDPEEYARIVQRARNGGKVSGYKKGARGVRRPEFGSSALQDGLSIREQAEALGKSVATIKRMRAVKKAEQLAEIDALFDTPQAPVDPILETKLADPVSEAVEPRTAGMSIHSSDVPLDDIVSALIPDTVPADWTAWTREDAHRHEEQLGLQNLDLSAFDAILTEA